MSHRNASEGLAHYRALLADLPELDEEWFTELQPGLLAKNPTAAGDLSGACMPLAWRLAEAHGQGRDDDAIYSLINEANSAVKRAIRSFSGRTYADFVRHVTSVVEERLATSGI